MGGIMIATYFESIEYSEGIKKNKASDRIANKIESIE